jgi:formylglycine-generating enzyme required for sulfatase activity
VLTGDDCDDTDPTLNSNDDDGDGASTCDGDCNDGAADLFPGATEVPYDGVDQDCDGSDLTDVDGDGFVGAFVGGLDCNDDDDTVHPGTVDGYDMADSDCDGLVDEDDVSEGDVILNEAMVNPEFSIDPDGEWFELHNVSGRDINLLGWIFSDDGSDAFEVEEDLIIEAGGYMVFGPNADEATNGGVVVDYIYTWGDMALSNGDDEFVITMGMTEIYGIAWVGGDWPYTSGYAMGWGGAGAWVLGESWCAQSSMLDGGDFGTPGAANDSCHDYIANHGGTMIKIDAQTFEMGCTAGMSSCDSGESPAHDVTLTNDFYIGETEVTQGEYEAMMGTNPSTFSSCGSDCPVDYVSWHMSAAFANAVSDFEGLEQCYTCTGSDSETDCSIAVVPYSCGGYRLPTEAEWEAAARCGEDTLYAGSTVITDVAWYSGNSGGTTWPVATKASNTCGLYDMSGNVWEYTQDHYDTSYYASSPDTDPVGPPPGPGSITFRGGSWNIIAADCDVAYRNWHGKSARRNDYGFRLARTSP